MRTSDTNSVVSILTAMLTLSLSLAMPGGDARAEKGCATELAFGGYQHTALDKACLEVEDTSAVRLKISNLGSSGCDGVSIDLGDVTGPPAPGIEMEFDRLSIALPGGSFTGRLTGQADGIPVDKTLMELRATNDGNSVLFTPDFTGVGSQSHTVEIWADGELVTSESGIIGPALRIPNPTFVPENWWFIKFGMVCPQPSDIIKVCVDTDGDGRIPMEILGTGRSVDGDTFRIIAEDRTGMPDFFSTAEIMAGGIPEMVVLSEDVTGTPIDPCQEPESPAARVLYVNGDQGGHDGPYGVQAAAGGLIWATMLLPESGGNGKYLVHANYGTPTPLTHTALPAQLGTFCFPLFLGAGATPAAVWNNIGKESQVGSSSYFDGSAIPSPLKAPAVFLLLHGGDATHLPVGTEVTFQGIIVDPSAASPKSASTTNAVTLEIL